MKQSLFLLPLSFALLSCGDSSSGFEMGFDEMEIVSGDSISIVESSSGGGAEVEGSITGSGLVRAKTALGGVDGDSHFQLSFEIAKDGYLDFLAFGDDNLSSGSTVRIRFACSAAGVLSVSVSGSEGSENVDVSTKITDAIGTGCTNSIALDVHNGETPTHILAWKSDVTAAKDNAAFNSESDASFPDTIKGSGTRWGLGLSDVTVTVAKAVAAKFEE